MLNFYKDLSESLNTFDFIVFITDSEPGLIAAISSVYPDAKHLLCIWQINKNVMVNCRAEFDDDDKWKEFNATWKTVLYAKTEEVFEDAWNAMRLKYQDNTESIDYFQELLRLHKTKIVKCFTDKIRHFGNTATSRSEGSHAKLKAELKSFTGKDRSLS